MTAISESDAMALQVTDVTKHYDSGFTLDDVTFDLPKGYIMGLIGPNGAGKSTLIKLILNMIRRTTAASRCSASTTSLTRRPSRNGWASCFDLQLPVRTVEGLEGRAHRRPRSTRHGTGIGIGGTWTISVLGELRTARRRSRTFRGACR